MSNWQILKRPIISEKSTDNVALGRYTFEVDRKADKGEIKKVVEAQFQVKVLGVKTVNIKPKSRWSGQARKKAFRKAYKKAVVQLAQGQKIDLFETQESKPKTKRKARKVEEKKEEKTEK